MTTLARIEANRRNAALSSGPRTPEGKALAARNATTHGIFAAVPVLPGESADGWERHRAGVVASLAPAGLLEVNLAERAALLLWRLQRLARYEAETLAAAVEAVEVPPLPPPQTPLSRLCPEPVQQTREEQLAELRAKHRRAVCELENLRAAGDLPPDLAGVDPVAQEVAAVVLEAAQDRADAAEGLMDDPPQFGTRTFLKRLGRSEPDARAVPWTADLLRRGLELYAGCAGKPPASFLAAVRADLCDRAAAAGRAARQLEREAAAVERLLDTRVDRGRAAQLLPADGVAERVARYERHLHSLLTSTLHELERLQARRGGEPVLPPAVADLNVTVTGPLA